MKEKNCKNLGELIHDKRKAKGLTFAELEEIAKKYGHTISGSYINRLETGKRKDPSTGILRALIESLDLSLEEVMKSLDMSHIYDQAIAKGVKVVIPDDLQNLNIVVPVDEEVIILSDKQKQLLGKMIGDLFYITLKMEPELFEKNAESYALELMDILEQEKYLVELEGLEFKLTFDVRIMIDRYNLLKQDIKKSLEQLDLNAIHLSDTAIPLYLFGEYWMTTRDQNRLIIVDKVSEMAKPYNKN